MFKCQVSYAGKDKVVEERVSEKFTILCEAALLIFFTSHLKLTLLSLCELDCEFCLIAPPEVSEIQLAETQNDSGETSALGRGLSETHSGGQRQHLNILSSRCNQHDGARIALSPRCHHVPLVLRGRRAESRSLAGILFAQAQLRGLLLSLQSVQAAQK